jgi:MFS family permease
MIGWAVGAVLFGKIADDFGTRAMAVILVVSGLLVYSITGPDARLRAGLLAASPSAP